MSLDILYPITWVVGGESHTRGYLTEEQREEEKKERTEEVREEKKKKRAASVERSGDCYGTATTLQNSFIPFS